MGGLLGVIPINIPNGCYSFEDFIAKIEESEQDFIKSLSIKHEASGEISICEE